MAEQSDLSFLLGTLRAWATDTDAPAELAITVAQGRLLVGEIDRLHRECDRRAVLLALADETYRTSGLRWQDCYRALGIKPDHSKWREIEKMDDAVIAEGIALVQRAKEAGDEQ